MKLSLNEKSDVPSGILSLIATGVPINGEEARFKQSLAERARDDVYVQRAQAEGYRSRACYKLLELNEPELQGDYFLSK